MVDHKGILYPGEHERIIEQNTWDRVHDNPAARTGRDNGASLKNKYGALLRGLLFCVPCGTPMMHTYTTRRESKRYRYYVCYNAQQQGWKNCETKSVPAQAIETAVLDSIRRLGSDPKLAEAVAAKRWSRSRRERAIDQEQGSTKRASANSTRNLRRRLPETELDSGARFERMATLQDEIRTAERRFLELPRNCER